VFVKCPKQQGCNETVWPIATQGAAQLTVSCFNLPGMREESILLLEVSLIHRKKYYRVLIIKT
jgi:hypothetical protein